MSAVSKNEPIGVETLSAVIDGEADAGTVSSACAAWRESAVTRTTWHAFHLIGDVMRSDDLASVPQRDAAFLGRLRERLATEPVVLAPQPLPVVVPASRRRRTWMGSAAVAAGFVAVAGVLVVMREPAALDAATPVAAAPAPTAAVVPVAVTAPAPAGTAVAEAAAETEALVRNGQVLRDARLDRYLAAHKQFAGSSALGVPSSFLRSATVGAANR